MKVKPKHINEYLDEVYNSSLKDIKDSDKVFEALSESINDVKDNYDSKSLVKEFEESNSSAEEFSIKKFEEAVHEKTFQVICSSHQNSWIQYTKEMLLEETI